MWIRAFWRRVVVAAAAAAAAAAASSVGGRGSRRCGRGYRHFGVGDVGRRALGIDMMRKRRVDGRAGVA